MQLKITVKFTDNNNTKDHNLTQLYDSTKTTPNLIGVILWHVVEMQLEQEIMFLQSTEHAGKAASHAVHPAEGRHADLTGLVAAKQMREQLDQNIKLVFERLTKHYVTYYLL